MEEDDLKFKIMSEIGEPTWSDRGRANLETLASMDRVKKAWTEKMATHRFQRLSGWKWVEHLGQYISPPTEREEVTEQAVEIDGIGEPRRKRRGDGKWMYYFLPAKEGENL